MRRAGPIKKAAPGFRDRILLANTCAKLIVNLLSLGRKLRTNMVGNLWYQGELRRLQQQIATEHDS